MWDLIRFRGGSKPQNNHIYVLLIIKQHENVCSYSERHKAQLINQLTSTAFLAPGEGQPPTVRSLDDGCDSVPFRSTYRMFHSDNNRYNKNKIPRQDNQHTFLACSCHQCRTRLGWNQQNDCHPNTRILRTKGKKEKSSGETSMR